MTFFINFSLPTSPYFIIIILIRLCEDEFEGKAESDNINCYNCFSYNYNHSSNYSNESHQLVSEKDLDLHRKGEGQNSLPDENNIEQISRHEERDEQVEKEQSNRFLEQLVKKQMQNVCESEEKEIESFVEQNKLSQDSINGWNQLEQNTDKDKDSYKLSKDNEAITEGNVNCQTAVDQEVEIAAILSGESELLKQHNVMG